MQNKRNLSQSGLLKVFSIFFSELPEEGPVISGGLSNYQLGEQLQLNCTSPRTFPPTLLKWYINNQLATEQGTIQYPSKRGTKNGLFRTQIGLNMTVSRECFKYGQIRVKCVGIIEDGILQGYSSQGSDGSSHQILEILLPEKLKRERPPATFFGKLNIIKVSINKAKILISLFSSQCWLKNNGLLNGIYDLFICNGNGICIVISSNWPLLHEISDF